MKNSQKIFILLLAISLIMTTSVRWEKIYHWLCDRIDHAKRIKGEENL